MVTFKTFTSSWIISFESRQSHSWRAPLQVLSLAVSCMTIQSYDTAVVFNVACDPFKQSDKTLPWVILCKGMRGMIPWSFIMGSELNGTKTLLGNVVSVKKSKTDEDWMPRWYKGETVLSVATAACLWLDSYASERTVLLLMEPFVIWYCFHSDTSFVSP